MVHDAIAWLSEAELALKARNQVMHAVPLVLFDRDSDGRRIESDRSALRYAPQGAAPTFGSSSSASLDDISQRLETLDGMT